MYNRLLHTHSPFRIFFISAFITIAALVAVFYWLGPAALLVTAILIVIEITFSFENAIINAKILNTLSRFWQQIFLTVGILIAVLGMRIIFPIVIVAITADLAWSDVIRLAIDQPAEYSRALESAQLSIAAFGGMFLLMLGLDFFISTKRKILWIHSLEAPLQARRKVWSYVPLCFVILTILSLIPQNKHQAETFIAGLTGMATYVIIHGLANFVGKAHRNVSTVKKTGIAGFIGFLYLEVLDASFSFDSVIGAFAVTQDVILIAVGLGLGAVWVRSLTIYMVRKRTLKQYKYLEHGAHYTIIVLASVLLLSLFIDVAEVIAGIASVLLIGASIVTSKLAKTKVRPI